MTSSTAAVAYGHADDRIEPYTDADWTMTDGEDVNAYTESKTRAELEAWSLVEDAGRRADFATVNPSVVLGPLLGADAGVSAEIIRRLLNGAPAAAEVSFNVVDVRDVAALHLAAMTDPRAGGHRYIAAAAPVTTFEIVGGLRSSFPTMRRGCRALPYRPTRPLRRPVQPRGTRDHAQSWAGAPLRFRSGGGVARAAVHHAASRRRRNRPEPHRFRPRAAACRAKKGLGQRRRDGLKGSRIRSGAVAQLGERIVRNDEVSGSIPLSSTTSDASLMFTGVLSKIGAKTRVRRPGIGLRCRSCHGRRPRSKQECHAGSAADRHRHNGSG